MMLIACVPGACALGGGYWDCRSGSNSGGRAKAAHEPMMLQVARWRGAHGFTGRGRAFAGGLSLRRKKMIEGRTAPCPQRLSLPQGPKVVLEHLLVPRHTFSLPILRHPNLMLGTWCCLYCCTAHAAMAHVYPTARGQLSTAWSSTPLCLRLVSQLLAASRVHIALWSYRPADHCQPCPTSPAR